MNKQKVYIDTSVIGGCFDEEFKKWSEYLVIDFKNYVFIPVLSEITKIEINKAPIYVKNKYLEILEYNAIYYEINEEIITLAREYLQKGIISENYFEDGLHIALATIHKIDILVSWNFRHIVHYDKIRQFNATNIESGYKTIEIYSPREVTTYED